MATPKDIGNKYGSSISDFATASANVIEDILIKHCNEGVELMRKRIYKKTKTGAASVLAQGISNMPAVVAPNSISITTISNETYHDYVNKGVKGVRNKNKAPQSPYRFRNLGAPPAMVESFKNWVSKTGMKTVVLDGKRKSLYKKDRKTGNKTARLDRIEEAAKVLAVRTKIGGIKPVNFTSQANNAKRNKQLKRSIIEGLGAAIKINIIKDINGNNNK
jgi:hypothetical protein